MNDQPETTIEVTKGRRIMVRIRHNTSEFTSTGIRFVLTEDEAITLAHALFETAGAQPEIRKESDNEDTD